MRAWKDAEGLPVARGAAAASMVARRTWRTTVHISQDGSGNRASQPSFRGFSFFLPGD